MEMLHALFETHKLFTFAILLQTLDDEVSSTEQWKNVVGDGISEVPLRSAVDGLTWRIPSSRNAS